MNGLRLTLVIPGATAAELLPVARRADHWNVGGLWIGDPFTRADNREDSYVTAAAAAVASVTVDLRIGVLLALPEDQQMIRIAEDVAVIDNASAGRIEVGLITPATGATDDWLQRAATFLRSWTDWPVPGGGAVAVTPLPVQPQIPRVIAGPPTVAQQLDAGWMATATEPSAERRLVPGRTIALAAPPLDPRAGGVVGWLGRDPVGRVTSLRADATAIGAQELLLVIEGGALSLTESDIEALGRAVVPGLRCVPVEIEGIVEDAWRWLTEQRALHEAPLEHER